MKSSSRLMKVRTSTTRALGSPATTSSSAAFITLWWRWRSGSRGLSSGNSAPFTRRSSAWGGIVPASQAMFSWNRSGVVAQELELPGEPLEPRPVHRLAGVALHQLFASGGVRQVEREVAAGTSSPVARWR